MNQIQHIAFHCADKKRQEAFYTKQFGFKRARVFNRGRPDEFVMLRLGNVCIELFQVAAGNATKRGGEQAVGFRHLAIEVSNIEEAAKRLEGDGIKTEGVKDCGSICPGLKICFFHDPDGNRIELLQGWTDETLK